MKAQFNTIYFYIKPESLIQKIMEGILPVKIGATKEEGDNSKRSKGQSTATVNIEPTVEFWTKSLKNSPVSSDKQLHDYLVENFELGFNRLQHIEKRSTEWFGITVPVNTELHNMAKEWFFASSAEKPSIAKNITDKAAKELKFRLVKIFDQLEENLSSKKEQGVILPSYTGYFSNKLAQLGENWYKNSIYLPFNMKFEDKSIKGNQPFIMQYALALSCIQRMEVGTNMPKASILVIEALEIAHVLKAIGYDMSKVTYASYTPSKRDDAIKLGCSVRDSAIMLEGSRSKMFDVCVQNPPYNGKSRLYCRFINLGMDVADKVVAVHPSTPFINRKPSEKAKHADEQKLIELVSKYHTNIELCNGMDLFSAKLAVPVSITSINTLIEETGINYEGQLIDQDRVCIAGAWANKFFDLISEDNLHTHANINKFGSNKGKTVSEGNYYVNGIWQRGGPVGYTGGEFNSMINKSTTPSTERSVNPGWLSWGFETEQEAQNLIGYMKTKFARFMLMLYKMNGNLHLGELRAVPWMDFTKEWTDEKLFAKFNVSQEDQEKILAFIPDYY